MEPQMADNAAWQLRASLRDIARLLFSMATTAANTADTVAGAGQCASGGVLLSGLTQRPQSAHALVSRACSLWGAMRGPTLHGRTLAQRSYLCLQARRRS